MNTETFERPGGLPRRALLCALALGAGLALGRAAPARAGERATVIPPAADDPPAGQAGTETAAFAGGCFWGVQGVFQHVKGVTSAVSGYAGGDAATANYEATSLGNTGHAESVRISYDPKQISFARLLQIHFSVAHDPTQRDRQGPDVGTQYRSTIFATNPEQARIAKNYIAQLDRARVFGKPIATTIEPLKAFYPAEAYHQDFMTRNPDHPYIAINDLPKVDNLKKVFPASYRAKPVLVGARA
ncbi:peptide-methionine (S)-S-oxide reductase MsrA [Variovorax saccharolyticus]|uniref:peptide-methionine (S)-S-oxide reductase MsrA n=1 Tax=Variovorax saccharolyticus TaxID=3053516 RepID=UPI0025774FA7|nr:peptide-methionine (S)-S-oxide reductase MsrA [Variovorax sp. J22R187]MDM0017902.1 peptide-methionine (S)-S-oxide reductase MsrA [Variovorax sp. J22R187]